jgi:predicted amidophosphoribosyltransferase
LSFQDLRISILQLDETQLNEQLLKQFVNFIPTNDESELLAEHASNYDNLGKPEQFFVEMLKISRYEQRLRSMIYKLKFMERYDEIKPDVMAITKASLELKKSSKLSTILEVISSERND